MRELSSGPRLRAAEDRASAACARVADVEKALHAALRSLGEKGLTNLLEEEDEEETTPLSERLAAAEVAVEAAQATALGATALAERLAKRLEDAERTARELAENATSHEDATADAVIEAVANLETKTNARLEALEGVSIDRRRRPSRGPTLPVLQSTPAAARAGELLKEQLGLSEENAVDDAPSIRTQMPQTARPMKMTTTRWRGRAATLDDARAVAEAVADEAVLRAEFAEQEAALLRERAGVLVQKLRDEPPPTYDEHTTHHGGEFVLAPPQSPARLDHASPVRRSAPSSPSSSRRSSMSLQAEDEEVARAEEGRRQGRDAAAEQGAERTRSRRLRSSMATTRRRCRRTCASTKRRTSFAPRAPTCRRTPARKTVKKKKKVVKKKVAKRPPQIETGAETAAERARRRVLASRRTGVTHRGPIGATWPDSVTHPRVVARVPSGAAWVPAMKVGTPRLRSASPAPTSAPSSGV